MSSLSIVKGILVNFVLPVAIVAGTFKAVSPLFEKKPTATTMPAAQVAQKVQASKVSASAMFARVSARGVAETARQMRLSAQVSGKLVSVSENLVVGGRFNKGDVLAKIDDRDYRLALRQQSTQLSKAELELQLESARGDVARRELAMLRQLEGEKKATNEGLVTRSLQLASAQVAVDAAKSGVEQAQLNLERTVIRAPFAGVVMEETAEVGQVISPATMLATLAGSDEIWVRVAIPAEDLRWISVRNGEQPGSSAVVRQRGRDEEPQKWSGEVIRLVHEVDRESRNAQVLVAVQHPFDAMPGQLPLLAGTFVEVEVSSAQPVSVIAIDRRSVFEGHFVWEIASDGKAKKRELQVAWGDDDFVYASGGIEEAAVIASRPLRRGIADAELVAELVPAPMPDFATVDHLAGTQQSTATTDAIAQDKEG